LILATHGQFRPFVGPGFALCEAYQPRSTCHPADSEILDRLEDSYIFTAWQHQAPRNQPGN